MGNLRRSVVADDVRRAYGRSDANIAFNNLLSVLHSLGFEKRVRGDHHILWKEGIPEMINLQPIGAKAKPYQVKQVRAILSRHELGFDDA